MSRYVRDEILIQGLELASSPTVVKHDMPNGVIGSDAFAVKWLQNALDFFHRKYPFASDIQEAELTIGASTFDAVLTSDATKFLPDDFIIDVKHGLIVTYNNARLRLRRLDFPNWLNYKLSTQSTTSNTRLTCYCIVNTRIKIVPMVSEAQAATLYYYALPTPLNADDPVPFPDEWVLIEYIRLKALEWTRSIEPGTAQMYLTKQLAGLRASGLLNEPEETSLSVENNQVILDSALGNRNAWMGNLAI